MHLINILQNAKSAANRKIIMNYEL